MGKKNAGPCLFQLNFDGDDQERREVLNLPMEGSLKPSEINAAFRRLAKTAHPDAGGSDEHYRRIAGCARRAARAIRQRLLGLRAYALNQSRSTPTA